MTTIETVQIRCPQCNASGRIFSDMNTSGWRTCPSCSGYGWIDRNIKDGIVRGITKPKYCPHCGKEI